MSYYHLFVKSRCPHCKEAKSLLKSEKVEHVVTSMDKAPSILTKLKDTYENYWKEINKINTSIKLPLTISVSSKSVNKIENLENILSKMDLVSSYNILRFDSNNIYFKIIYNGSPKKFLQEMIENKIYIETQGQIWRVG